MLYAMDTVVAGAAMLNEWYERNALVLYETYRKLPTAILS